MLMEGVRDPSSSYDFAKDFFNFYPAYEKANGRAYVLEREKPVTDIKVYSPLIFRILVVLSLVLGFVKEVLMLLAVRRGRLKESGLF